MAFLAGRLVLVPSEWLVTGHALILIVVVFPIHPRPVALGLRLPVSLFALVARVRPANMVLANVPALNRSNVRISLHG